MFFSVFVKSVFVKSDDDGIDANVSQLNWNRINCGRKYDAARSGLERYALEHWSGKSRGRNVGKGEKEGKIGRKRR